MKINVILIPTYNECKNIELLINHIYTILPDINIIIIDDNSPDGTGELVEKLRQKYKHLNIIHRQKNRGYGPSLKEGLMLAVKQHYQFIVTMDADLSHNPKVIPELIRKAKDYSVVVGSRYVEGGKIEADWGVFRMMVSRLGSRFAKAMLGLSLNDCTSGFRCYQSKIIKKLSVDSINSNGYSFLIELLYKCKQANATFFEVPITYIDRQHGQSKLSRKIVIEALLKVIKIGVKRVLNVTSIFLLCQYF